MLRAIASAVKYVATASRPLRPSSSRRAAGGTAYLALRLFLRVNGQRFVGDALELAQQLIVVAERTGLPTEDFVEGRRAEAEGRPPVYKGR